MHSVRIRSLRSLVTSFEENHEQSGVQKFLRNRMFVNKEICEESASRTVALKHETVTKPLSLLIQHSDSRAFLKAAALLLEWLLMQTAGSPIPHCLTVEQDPLIFYFRGPDPTLRQS